MTCKGTESASHSLVNKWEPSHLGKSRLSKLAALVFFQFYRNDKAFTSFSRATLFFLLERKEKEKKNPLEYSLFLFLEEHIVELSFQIQCSDRSSWIPHPLTADFQYITALGSYNSFTLVSDCRSFVKY